MYDESELHTNYDAADCLYQLADLHETILDAAGYIPDPEVDSRETFVSVFRQLSVQFSTSDLVRFEGRPMRFQNVNGEDILIYPGMAIMPRSDGAFALIDLRELRLEFDAVQFIEEEAVPSDAKVVGATWAKVNKDGSRDLRFRDNYQIPICLYGRLTFTSTGGVEEEYQFSDADAAGIFARAFRAYQATLSAA